jgi:hypothetical protein
MPRAVPRILLIPFLSLVSAQAAGDSSRAPVLVELFTSEGCSSCPPADRLLEQLDSRAIVLSEHVDYWDHLGWRDPFSSAAFSLRQESYGRQFRLDSVYTPEMVVDGAVEFTGADAVRANAEIAKAARRKKATVRIARTGAGLEIAVDDAPRSADVYLALADDSGTSQVAAGENRGRNLRYVAIVRGIRKIGSVRRGVEFHKVMELPTGSGAQRIVVFLQEDGTGEISGTALLGPL